jgi:hypothetical protein
VKLVLVCLLVAALASSCGSMSNKRYSLQKTRQCLRADNVPVAQRGLDFVATTATGGAVRARLGSNFVTIVFGETMVDADNINDAYHRFRSRNVGIEDVLRQQQNAVMLWHQHPSDADLARVTGCLK